MLMRPEPLSLKSAARKVAAPLVAPSASAFAMESVEPENERGAETVVDWSVPLAVVERSAPGVLETMRLVVEAVLKSAVPVKVGLLEKTTEPEPVSSERSEARSADDWSDEEESLEEKVVQSVEERYPF